jgi:hypothetical protein
VLSQFDPLKYSSYNEWLKLKEIKPVVIQWDPDRDIFLNKVNRRAIQIGLTPPAANIYVDEWILKITDITQVVYEIKHLIDTKKIAEAKELVPVETIYPDPQV